MPSGPYPTSLAKGHVRSKSRPNALDKQAEQAASPDTLVAIKLISRSHIKKNDRMRISIVREVEVLKHIRHPSLVHLTSSFETPWHTCLVLEYAAGGELFDFIADHHEHTSEALVRRIFGELADVLGWMHSIGLVHRDIKLENILLTYNPFASGAPPRWPEPSSLPQIPTPLVKLTDFGLSRFVDLSSPYLETRCGSEEYAAPELIMGKRYDGRQTDAWALGVVLYALIVGHLPFVEDGGVGQHDAPDRSQASPSAKGSMRSRKAYLLKIAKGEYRWPEQQSGPTGEPIHADETRLVNEHSKSLVGGLLTRDPKKRLRTEDIWDMDWMSGAGMPEKRFVKGGGLEGVALTAFERDDEAMVRAEVPDPG
ncbi:kinase-like protein [Cystobasidium minutum MCA 4210]|uniref:kinase-like protein n=1 Tax=Cystobasidium minutum MCA 4210 TaxID=1397322 RepID=UPI0034CF9766|eukprot:jgi/Rhomi1/146099/e_gw1.6.656.1